MKEFVMIFRMDTLLKREISPDEMQDMMKAWQNWMGVMATRNKLVSSSNLLGNDGRAVKSAKMITNGPYAEVMEIIGGYVVVRANSIDDAAEMAKGCPMVIGGGGMVEVRNVVDINS
jgi:hypothetical protein